MSVSNVTEQVISIIPIAATTAVLGHTLNLIAKPIKKGKAKDSWF